MYIAQLLFEQALQENRLKPYYDNALNPPEINLSKAAYCKLGSKEER